MKKNKSINNKLNCAKKYAKRGWAVIPVVPDGKRPLTPHGYKDGTTEVAQIEKWWKQHPKANIGVVMGEVSKIFVLDEDKHGETDGSKITAILEKLLEDFDTYTVATPSGGRHFYFKFPQEGMKCKTAVFEGIDIKGDGGYVLGAGSIALGKRYKLINNSEIKDAPPLLLVFLKYGENALPPVRLSEGGRNNELFKYACRLREMGIDSGIILKIALCANRTFLPPMDDVEIVGIVQSAVNRTGPNGLESEILAKVEELNQQYAVVLVGGKLAVMRFYTDYKTGMSMFDFMGVADFHNFLKNKSIGKSKKAISQLWLAHDQRRTYERITFEPGHPVPKNVFNMWRGYGVEPIEGDCRKFLNFIKGVICEKDKELYEYVIAWLANVFQNPANRPHTALALYGGQGVGKSFFATEIGKLWGQHFLHITGFNPLISQFTATFKDKCMVFIDEATWDKTDRKGLGVLKDRISGETYLMEAKGKDAIELPNYMHFILASNERTIVPAAIDERRYVLLHVSDKYKLKTAYFGKLKGHLETGGYEALLYYLLHYDYSDVDLRIVPNTRLLQDMKLEHLVGVQAFWFEVLKRGYITSISQGWPKWISIKNILGEYSQQTGHDYNKSMETSAGFELKKLLPKTACIKKRQGIRGYVLPQLEKCREHFCEMIRVDFQWE